MSTITDKSTPQMDPDRWMRVEDCMVDVMQTGGVVGQRVGAGDALQDTLTSELRTNDYPYDEQ